MQHRNAKDVSGKGKPAEQVVAVAVAVAGWKTDRNHAIAEFQKVERIPDGTEVRTGSITPGGKTWAALFTYGRIAHELELVRDKPKHPNDFIYHSHFDSHVVIEQFQGVFRSDVAARQYYSRVNQQNMLQVLGLITKDPRVIDIRWMAYILATVFWETGQEFAPIDEIGKGRLNATNHTLYYLPAKVRKNSDNTVQVTEQDGDQFSIKLDGSFKPLRLGAQPGSIYGKPVSPAYEKDEGQEHKYYGRGYVQLTWWSGYASTGAAIGQGLKLLFDPESAKDPEIAYAVLSAGMCDGKGFAGGKRLQQYIFGSVRRYEAARAIVNGVDHAFEIAHIAELFEQVLMESRE